MSNIGPRSIYEEGGRVRAPPERVLEATLLTALFSARSERLRE